MGINTGKLPRLSWPSVLARRLERHALVEPSPGAQPAEVIGALCFGPNRGRTVLSAVN
jgi:hypothetical protein